jgi:hypothetical protein
MLNYLYALLEAEARLAAAAMGLDPGLGFLHLDTTTRDSLACDLMEPVRPQIDAFVLDWISREPMKREWFFEQRDGTCRLMADFTSQLSETLPMWRRAVAPVTELTAEVLWAARAGATRKPGPATRLTGRRYREAMGGASPRRREQSVKPQSLCRTCGASVDPGGKYCRACSVAKTDLTKEGDGRMSGVPHFLLRRLPVHVLEGVHAIELRSWIRASGNVSSSCP